MQLMASHLTDKSFPSTTQEYLHALYDTETLNQSTLQQVTLIMKCGIWNACLMFISIFSISLSVS
jgi:hypothetical protein